MYLLLKIFRIVQNIVEGIFETMLQCVEDPTVILFDIQVPHLNWF